MALDRTTRLYAEGVNEPDNMPRLPEDRLEAPPRKAGELKPGEQAVISLLFGIRVDQERRVWVDASATVESLALIPGMTALVERTEAGFILWLDKKASFSQRELGQIHQFLPVVEFRESPGEKT